MIFERLGNFIAKRYKLVLVLWIVALIACAPLLMRANDVVTYEQNASSGTATSDSEKAAAILEREFPREVSNSSLIVVIEADNVSSPAMRDFLLSFESRVKADSKITYFEPPVSGAFPKDFISVYTAESYVLKQAVPGMNIGMYQMAGTLPMVWGTPAQYMGAYLAAGYNDSAADAAVNATIQGVSASNQTVGAMMDGYYAIFKAQWNANATVANATLMANPQLRAEVSARAAVNVFAASVPAVQGQMMLAVANSFNVTTFTNATMQRAFVVGAIAVSANITDLNFLYGTYDLGDLSLMSTANSTAAVDNFVANVVLPNGTIDTYPVKMPSDFLSSFVSPDGRVTIISLAFTKGEEWADAGGKKPIVENVAELRVILSDLRATSNASGLATYVSGGAAISTDTMKIMMSDMAIIEFVTIPLIIILMGLFFRSIVAPALPLGVVMVALGLSQAIVYIIGVLMGSISSEITTMLFSILMGVGTDYSIFIVARFREERIRGASREDAVKTSVTWAGESVVTSGATVMIAFLSLCIGSYSLVRIMGVVMGLAILVAILVSLTLVPSILMLVGNRIFWPNNKEKFKRYSARLMERRAASQHGYFYKAAKFSVSHAKLVVLIAVLVTIPTTYIYLTAETGFDFIGSMPKVESIKGMEAMTNGFGAGRIMPSNAVIVFESDVLMPDGNYSIAALRTIENVSAALSREGVVHDVSGLTRPYGTTVDYEHPANISSGDLAKMREYVGQDNRTVRFTITLNAQPMSKAAIDGVSGMRSSVRAAVAGQGVSEAYVGGTTPGTYDTKVSMDKEFGQMQILVIIGIFIVLVFVLGSLFLPTFAILSILMSISWSFAATVIVFQYWLGVPILFLIPLILFIMLMGLGMDYNIFILTRIREEVHKGKSDEDAIVDAVDWTGSIITALAVIMGGAIGVLMLSSTKMLAEFGFAIAFAVLLDAMVVRTYIVPATMKLLGKWNWYAPGPLQRERRENKQ